MIPSGRVPPGCQEEMLRGLFPHHKFRPHTTCSALRMQLELPASPPARPSPQLFLSSDPNNKVTRVAFRCISSQDLGKREAISGRGGPKGRCASWTRFTQRHQAPQFFTSSLPLRTCTFTSVCKLCPPWVCMKRRWKMQRKALLLVSSFTVTFYVLSKLKLVLRWWGSRRRSMLEETPHPQSSSAVNVKGRKFRKGKSLTQGHTIKTQIRL